MSFYMSLDCLALDLHSMTMLGLRRRAERDGTRMGEKGGRSYLSTAQRLLDRTESLWWEPETSRHTVYPKEGTRVGGRAVEERVGFGGLTVWEYYAQKKGDQVPLDELVVRLQDGALVPFCRIMVRVNRDYVMNGAN